jgi:hypothetical protein
MKQPNKKLNSPSWEWYPEALLQPSNHKTHRDDCYPKPKIHQVRIFKRLWYSTPTIKANWSKKLPHVPSQGPHLIVSQNPDTTRLWANNRALQIRDRDGAPHLFAAGHKGVLLKITVIHLPKRITAERLWLALWNKKIQPIIHARFT